MTFQIPAWLTCKRLSTCEIVGEICGTIGHQQKQDLLPTPNDKNQPIETWFPQLSQLPPHKKTGTHSKHPKTYKLMAAGVWKISSYLNLIQFAHPSFHPVASWFKRCSLLSN